MNKLVRCSILALAGATAVSTAAAGDAAALPVEAIVVVAAASASAPAGSPAGLRAVSRPSPEYPARPLIHGITQGMVVLDYTVAADGTVGDIAVVRGEPYYGFNQNARRAVADWRFEAPGTPVQRRVRFVFVAQS